MKSLSKLSTQIKLLILMLVVMVGFGVIGIISFLNISVMNKNINTIYFGVYVKVLKLNNIINSYHIGVFETIYRLNMGLISQDEAKRILFEASKNISSEWDYYFNAYQKELIKPTVLNANEEIKKSLLLIDSLLGLMNLNDKKLKNTKLNEFFEAINSTIAEINKLIKYERDNAYILKNQINESYDETRQNLLITILVVFICSIAIAIIISRNIHQNQVELELTAKKLEIANENLKNLSLTDPMTGLYNRRYFDMVVERELRRAVREESYISFFMLDVDHFKLYNDTYGHQMGDEVLKSVAKALQASAQRASDYAFRLGGEEFAIFAYGLDSQKAAELAKKVLDNVKALNIEHKSSKTDNIVTVSIGGYSVIPTKEMTKEILIKKADDALYKAKNEGRNRAYILEQ